MNKGAEYFLICITVNLWGTRDRLHLNQSTCCLMIPYKYLCVTIHSYNMSDISQSLTLKFFSEGLDGPWPYACLCYKISPFHQLCSFNGGTSCWMIHSVQQLHLKTCLIVSLTTTILAKGLIRTKCNLHIDNNDRPPFQHIPVFFIPTS